MNFRETNKDIYKEFLTKKSVPEVGKTYSFTVRSNISWLPNISPGITEGMKSLSGKTLIGQCINSSRMRSLGYLWLLEWVENIKEVL